MVIWTVALCGVQTTLCGEAFGFDERLQQGDRPVVAQAWRPLNRIRPALDQGGENCLDATVISALPYSATGTTASFADDYFGECGAPNGSAPDVVYSFTPDSNVVVQIHTCGSHFDTRLYVYEAACPGFAIACNDDACDGADSLPLASRIYALPLSEGETYFIVVDGSNGEQGNYALEIAEVSLCPSPPLNDSCSAVAALPLPQWYSGETNCATVDCPEFPLATVWIAFHLDSCSNVVLGFCDTDPPMSNAWLNCARSCDCSTLTSRAVVDTLSCGDGSPVLRWSALPAGDYFYPIMAEIELRYEVTVYSTPCAACDVCIEGSTPEAEPSCESEYIDRSNGGCDAEEILFMPLQDGDVICGTAGSYLLNGIERQIDTDWYGIQVAESSTVTSCVHSEHDAVLHFVLPIDGCNSLEFLDTRTVYSCVPFCNSLVLPPATYWISLAPLHSIAVPCTSRYQLSLEIVPLLICDSLARVCIASANETESNDTCGVGVDSLVLDCGGSVSGLICPRGDRDLFVWNIPENTRSTLSVFSAQDDSCNAQPAFVSLSLIEAATCLPVSGVLPSSTFLQFIGPASFIVAVEAIEQGEIGDYRMEISCDALDFCEAICLTSDTITLGETLTLNTCAGCGLYPGTPEFDCTGPAWLSGPQSFVVVCVETTGVYCVELSGDTLTMGGSDVQFCVFQDCEQPTSSCVFSADVNYPGNEINGPFYTETACDTLFPGDYVIGASSYDILENGTTCGLMTVRVTRQLPQCNAPLDVRIFYDATSGEVTLHWISVSSSDFRIWQTTFKDNDGDPNGGADPQWTALATVTAAPGMFSFADSLPLVSYRAYAVTKTCP